MNKEQKKLLNISISIVSIFLLVYILGSIYPFTKVFFLLAVGVISLVRLAIPAPVKAKFIPKSQGFNISRYTLIIGFSSAFLLILGVSLIGFEVYMTQAEIIMDAVVVLLPVVFTFEFIRLWKFLEKNETAPA